MRILVTGGAGFIGRSLVDDLLARGVEARVFDKTMAGLAELKNPALELIEGGIEDKQAVQRAVKDIDVIYHLAETFSSDPYEIFDIDVKGTVNLLESAVEYGVKHFLFVSTHRVCGKPRYVPIDEEHPLHPEESRRPLYSVSKLTREQLCLTYWREHGLPATIFRWFYSVHPDRALQGRALTTLVDSSLKGEPIRVPEKGGGNFFLTDDTVHAFRLATLNDKAYGEVFNLSSGTYTTWREVAGLICELANSSSRLELIPAEEWRGDASFSSDPTLSYEYNLDISKAERLIGYKSKYSPQEVMSSLRESTNRLILTRKKG